MQELGYPDWELIGMGGIWTGAGVLGPEAFDAVPFLDLLAGEYASPWGLQELDQG